MARCSLQGSTFALYRRPNLVGVVMKQGQHAPAEARKYATDNDYFSQSMPPDCSSIPHAVDYVRLQADSSVLRVHRSAASILIMSARLTARRCSVSKSVPAPVAHFSDTSRLFFARCVMLALSGREGIQASAQRAATWRACRTGQRQMHHQL